MNHAGKATYQLAHLKRRELVAELYSRYGRKLHVYAINTWRMGEDASWDLVYRTLYKVIDSLPRYSFESEEKFGSFVFRIFINYLKNYYRDHKKEFENMQLSGIDPDQVAHTAVAEHAVEPPADARLKVLNEELDKMEDWQRILLLMRSDGRPYAEIATYVDKPEEQLKVYYQRLKKLLTDKINEQIQGYDK